MLQKYNLIEYLIDQPLVIICVLILGAIIYVTQVTKDFENKYSFTMVMLINALLFFMAIS